jgi:hypothetical protein
MCVHTSESLEEIDLDASFRDSDGESKYVISEVANVKPALKVIEPPQDLIVYQ